jgi:hypothetical protein
MTDFVFIYRTWVNEWLTETTNKLSVTGSSLESWQLLQRSRRFPPLWNMKNRSSCLQHAAKGSYTQPHESSPRLYALFIQNIFPYYHPIYVYVFREVSFLWSFTTNILCVSHFPQACWTFAWIVVVKLYFENELKWTETNVWRRCLWLSWWNWMWYETMK